MKHKVVIGALVLLCALQVSAKWKLTLVIPSRPPTVQFADVRNNGASFSGGSNIEQSTLTGTSVTDLINAIATAAGVNTNQVKLTSVSSSAGFDDLIIDFIINDPADPSGPVGTNLGNLDLEFRFENGTTGLTPIIVDDILVTKVKKDDTVTILAAVFGSLAGMILIAGAIYAYKQKKNQLSTSPMPSRTTISSIAMHDRSEVKMSDP